MLPTYSRCVLYRRVSTEEQSDNGVSLDVQERDCLRTAAAHGWTVVDSLVDEGYSAYSRKPRPAYQDLLRRLDEWDCVMVWRLDRFGRRNREIQSAADDIIERGIALYSVTEQFDATSPAGRLMLSLLAAFAQYEPDNLSSRVRPAMEEAARQGRHLSFAPYGYTLPVKGQHATIIPDPATAPIVQEIFRRYLAGERISDVCRWLNEADIRTVRGNRWDHSRLASLLRSHTYAGLVTHTPSGLVTEGVHEALVDRRTWEAAQHRLAAGKRAAPASRGHSLSALLRCGHCGGSMSANSGARGHRSYGCRWQRHIPEHPSIYISGGMLESLLWQLVEYLLSPGQDSAYAEGLAAQGNRRRQASRARELEARREALQGDLRYHLQVARAQAMPPELLAELTGELREELRDVEARMLQMEAGGMPHYRTSGALVRHLRELQAGGYEQQRRYLERIIRQVDVRRDRLVVHLHADLPPLHVDRHYRRDRLNEPLTLDFLEPDG